MFEGGNPLLYWDSGVMTQHKKKLYKTINEKQIREIATNDNIVLRKGKWLLYRSVDRLL